MFDPTLTLDAASASPSLASVASSYEALLEQRLAVERRYAAIDAAAVDHASRRQARGLAWHASGLPKLSSLPSLMEMSDLACKRNKSVQRKLSQVVHHHTWLGLYDDMGSGASPTAMHRERARLVSASQPGADAFLYSVPANDHFKMGSRPLAIALLRRLGLYLPGIAALDGLRPADYLGDTLLADGKQEHTTRHNMTNNVWYAAATAAFGAASTRKPRGAPAYL